MFSDVGYAIEEAEWMAQVTQEPHAIVEFGEMMRVMPLSVASGRILEIIRPTGQKE